MPELPDVEVFTRNLHSIFAGSRLLKLKVVNGKKLADKPAALSRAIAGKKLTRIFRSGKEMRFEFDEERLVGLHLMLTGDVFVFEKQNRHPFVIVELHFDNGKGLALCDRMRNANIKLDPEDKAGIDALSPKMNFKYLKTILDRDGKIKAVLTNQALIRGIGNSYSDEILWQARISPYSISRKIPVEKVRQMSKLIKTVLRKEVSRIFKNHPGLVNGEIKEYLQIHTRAKTHSPSGFPIKIDKSGMMKTYYTSEQKLYR